VSREDRFLVRGVGVLEAASVGDLKRVADLTVGADAPDVAYALARISLHSLRVTAKATGVEVADLIEQLRSQAMLTLEGTES
jgi:predicted nicotinamide N-methyase